MTQFKDEFIKASPVKQIAGNRAERLRKRAQRRSERSGETGGYNYSDPKVVKLLDKAKKIENKNFIKSKVSSYNEDARVSASYERPDMDTSPLPVTATQAITSDMYYQPREEMDYSTMIAAAGDMGAKSARKQAKKDCEDSERTYTETEDEEGKITTSCN